MNSKEILRSGEPLAGNEQQERSFLQEVVKDTITRFHAKKSYRDERKRKIPYLLVDAATDALLGTGKTALELFDTIARETSFTPLSLADHYPVEIMSNSWDEFRFYMAQAIVNTEINLQHPELQEEVDRRLRRYQW